MSSSQSIIRAVVGAILKALFPGTPRTPQESGRSDVPRPRATLRPSSRTAPAQPTQADAGRTRGSETVQVDPERITNLQLSYSPDRDGAPDAGEIIWTWVPYEENDGRGKDRPVLVIARESAHRVYAVRLTSKAHDRDRDYLSIGSGAWDSQGRESWVDIEQLYSVHEDGLRREAAELDRARFSVVATALSRRYGWKTS